MENYPDLATHNSRFPPPTKDNEVASGLHVEGLNSWIQSLRDGGIVRALTSAWINPLVDWKLESILEVGDIGLCQAEGHCVSLKLSHP